MLLLEAVFKLVSLAEMITQGFGFVLLTSVALFVTPLVVILGWIMDKEMTLYFTLFETISLFVTAFVVNFLVLDGRSNYLEGALLCSSYLIIAYVPTVSLSQSMANSSIAWRPSSILPPMVNLSSEARPRLSAKG